MVQGNSLNLLQCVCSQVRMMSVNSKFRQKMAKPSKIRAVITFLVQFKQGTQAKSLSVFRGWYTHLEIKFYIQISRKIHRNYKKYYFRTFILSPDLKFDVKIFVLFAVRFFL